MAIVGLRYKGRWAEKVLKEFGFTKRGQVRKVPDEVSEADAYAWAQKWPAAFEIVEGPEPTRSIDEPQKHRMRTSPARKRGKTE